MNVTFENVKKSFNKELVLNIPSLSLRSGEQCVVVGGSGQGKTTLLNLIAGIYLPDNGKIKVGDIFVNDLSEEKRDRFRAKHIGFIFQTFNLLPELTVIDNIHLATTFGNTKNRNKVMPLLEKIGLADKANAYPRTLSVGQRQRVAVVRAIINDPGLILADEPTGSLDMENKINTLKLIQDLCKEGSRTLLIVSHDEFVANQFIKQIKISDIIKKDF